jgi:hypothetical protein
MPDTHLNSVDYYRDREQYERNLAANAASSSIRQIHLDMAEAYRRMVDQLELHSRSQAREERTDR